MYQLNYFNFKERKNNYLITNDMGQFAFVPKSEFKKMIKKEKLNEKTYNELIEKGFIFEGSEEIFATKVALKVRKQKEYLLVPTTLHIFVVSKNCNFNCIYCQAGKLNNKNDYKMTKDIAKKAVDIALQSPSDYLTFEFQGGEPLTNFEVIKYIVEYSKEVGKEKKIEYNLVSNLTLLTDEIMKFLIDNDISICTSIDGNKEIQNKNRPYAYKDSYQETVNKIIQLRKKGKNVNAIETTTKYSLKNYKEIVDEYINLGLENIFIRPLTRLGKADENWKNIGYEAKEFLEFYKNTIEYIIEKNKKGFNLVEGYSSILLKKILSNNPINYMELRSPCGGAIGQLAYYYDGNIYTCDEGRMLAEMGNDSFKLGNVESSSYIELMESNTTKAMCVSSCIECLPYCSNCVYMPYCGTCPVINLAQDENIFASYPKEFRCKIYGGILDILFDYIEKQDNDVIEIFRKWI